MGIPRGPSIKDVSSEGEGGGMKNCKLGRLSKLKWGDRGREEGTVPAITFKLDILAEKVNFMNLNNLVFFNILDTPFEP